MSLSSFGHIISEPTDECSKYDESNNTVVDETDESVDALWDDIEWNKKVREDAERYEGDSELINYCEKVGVEEVANEIREEDRNVSQIVHWRSIL